MMCGGPSEVKDADAEIQQICETIKQALSEKLGKDLATFTAIKYSSQVVAGTNFFVKIQIGDGEFVHVRIHRPLPHTGQGPEYVSHQVDKTLDSAVEYF